jgi:transcriptional regulator with XRE-family HTH domain
LHTEKIGAFLALLRKEQGLTQQAVAERLNLSNKTISKWESGAGLPDITVLPPLAELYGITADELLAGERLPARSAGQAVPQGAETSRYLLVRARQRFEVCMVPAAAGSIVWSFFSPPGYCCLLCPALVLIGWILLLPGARASTPLRQALCPFAVRLTLPVLLLWEWGFRYLPWLAWYQTGARTPGHLLYLQRWSILFWAGLALLTLWLGQLFVRQFTGRTRQLAAPWLLTALSAALLETGLAYALWFTQRYASADIVVAEVLRELRQLRFTAAIPPLKAALWAVPLLALLLCGLPFLRRRRAVRGR